jgi:hypothetical protein
MTAAALLLYGLAAICFLAVAGNVESKRINPIGLGLFCCALLWFLQVLAPIVRQ